MLFSGRSIWTMVHGMGLGGAALIGLAAACFYLFATRPATGAGDAVPGGSRALGTLTLLTAALLWLTVILGTYVVFPPYRATPPAGTLDLSAFPRSFVQSSADTAWLHGFAMESKEHMSWIAAMLASAAAFVVARGDARLLRDRSVRTFTMTVLAIALALVAFVSLMGVFVNKVAPLQ